MATTAGNHSLENDPTIHPPHRAATTNFGKEPRATKFVPLTKVHSAPDAGHDAHFDSADALRTDISELKQSKSTPSRDRAQTPIKPIVKRPTELHRAMTVQLRDESDTVESSSESEEDSVLGEKDKTKPKAKRQDSLKSEAEEQDQHVKSFSRFSVGNKFFHTKGAVSARDGRLNFTLHERKKKGYLGKSLGREEKRFNFEGDSHISFSGVDGNKQSANLKKSLEWEPENIPRLNIAILVIGSRGDIQPFMKIGKVLKEKYGHRVRIATHNVFKDFVEKDNGLEFFPIGGDPAELMAFMVKNPGMIPSLETVRAGEIGRKRAQMYEMFQGMWRACVYTTNESAVDQSGAMFDVPPFTADAIIANPPSFAHVHIAERLGIPLHIIFTFPYSPTASFPHPMANVKASNVDRAHTNFLSYSLVEMLTWQGLGDLINRFREKSLALEPVNTLWAPGRLYRMKVQHTYMWSPKLVPKPIDWGNEIDVTGFVFLEMASTFKPPESLVKFLDAGPPPVYIGFGSIVVDDADRFTNLIFKAVKMAGVRALVSKGWGGLGNEGDIPDYIYMLENTPHDWLFPRVSATVIHGGAGTTAMALKCAKPTFVVSFFGDQPFWGAMIARAKAGGVIPYKKLTVQNLADGIKYCLTDEAKKHAAEISESILAEGDGAVNAVKSFHRSLPLEGPNSMRCDILAYRPAVWKVRGSRIKLSSIAAERLTGLKKIKWQHLEVLRHLDWTDYQGPGEPVTGLGSAIVGTVSDAAKGLIYTPVHIARDLRKREEAAVKRHELEKAEKKKRASIASGLEEDVPSPVSHEVSDSDLGIKPVQHTDTFFDEVVHNTSHGMHKTGRAVYHAPMVLSLAVTRGFHNAPRLYGDETVRRPIRVQGIRSGLRAGSEEFVYGVHDAFTGLYRLPARGLKENGAAGLAKGVGQGVGGFFLKNASAVTGPPAYLMMGIHEQHQRAKMPWRFVRRKRIIQGQKETSDLSPDELRAVKLAVDENWDDWMKDEVNRTKKYREKHQRALEKVKTGGSTSTTNNATSHSVPATAPALDKTKRTPTMKTNGEADAARPTTRPISR